jgi:hypothetical protein
MNQKEYETWLQGHCAAFPEVAAALNKSPAKAATKKMWMDILANVNVDDALTVTMRMLQGRDGYPEPEHTQLHRTPSMVATYARKVFAERTRKEVEIDAPVLPPAKGEPLDMKKLWQDVAEEVAKGGNAYEVSTRLYPLRDDEQRRYHCLICEDLGLARVWHRDAMKAASQGTLKPERGANSQLIRCSCRRGDAHEEFSYRDHDHAGQRLKNPVIYNEQDWLTYEHFENGRRYRGNTPDGVARLVEFMRSRVPSHGVSEFAY